MLADVANQLSSCGVQLGILSCSERYARLSGSILLTVHLIGECNVSASLLIYIYLISPPLFPRGRVEMTLCFLVFILEGHT